MKPDALPHVVRLRDSVTKSAATSLKLSRILGWAGVVTFTTLSLFSLVALLLQPSTERTRDDVLPGVMATVFFGIMALLAWWLVRQSRAGSDHRQLLESKVALTITESTLEFPGLPGKGPAESWPLTSTRSELRQSRVPSLILTSDGRKPRQLAAHLIAEPLEQVQQRILEAQRGCSTDR